MSHLPLMTLACILTSCLPRIGSAHDVASELTTNAKTFLQSLDDTQTQQVQSPFDDPLRKDWQFVPMDRKGLGLQDMNAAQRHLAMSLIQTALSHRGFSQTMEIMTLEQVLFEIERGNRRRDAAKYHVFIFGTPSNEAPWGWRIEGHHLSISFTIVDGKTVVTTPAFFGTNPAKVQQGKLKGLRVLAAEEDLARELVNKLSFEQKVIAILPGEAPRDVINGPGRAASALTPAGIAASKLTDAQQKLLTDLIATYLNKFRQPLADADWQRIRDAGFENIHFAWAGKTTAGQPHYYRVQGPTFILEFDNTQNGANHVHTVWRDFKNDFGEDLLRKHYQKVPHESSATQ